MKSRLVIILTLTLVLVMAFAAVAQAGVSQATIDNIIKDAADGQVDGDWTPAQIRAALDYVQNDSSGHAYSETEGVLEDYLGSLQAPGAAEGELAFTGAPLALLLVGGAALVGGGALLRRR